MRKLLFANIILLVGLSIFMAFLFNQYHPVIALNKAVQNFVQNPNKDTYQMWFDQSAYMFEQQFLALSFEAQIVKFDKLAETANTNSLLKIQILNPKSVTTQIVDTDLEKEIIESSILPIDVEIVTEKGEVARDVQLTLEFVDSKSAAFIAKNVQVAKKQVSYKGVLEKSDFITHLNREFLEIQKQIQNAQLEKLAKITDLDSEKLNNLLRRRPDTVTMLSKTSILNASWQTNQSQGSNFKVDTSLQTENCPRGFSLSVEILPIENLFKFDSIARLILDLCNSEGIIPLTCINCALAPVDKVYKLSTDYVPNVINTNLPGGGSLTPETVANLKNMFEDAAKNGAPMKIFSAYRSYQNQVATFDYWYKREIARGLNPSEARISANKYSALPGHSEHQLGTTVDVGCDTCNSFDNSPGNLKVYAFIEANAHKYGFVVSYPKGTTQFTGYNYEPWHIRYVGVEIATELFNMGYLKQNGEYLAKLLVQKQQY